MQHWDGYWCFLSGAKLVYRNSESVSEFEVRMRKLSIYLKSEHMVYPLSIASCHFKGMKSSKQVFHIQHWENLDSPLQHWSDSWCCPSDPKMLYGNSEFDSKFEVSKMLPCVYQMRENGSIIRMFTTFLSRGCSWSRRFVHFFLRRQR